MINLIVENYCHECPSFEANVVNITSVGEVKTTNITCKHRERCKSIKNYLKSIGDKDD